MTRLSRKDAASLRSWEDRLEHENEDRLLEQEEPDRDHCDNCDQETDVSEFNDDLCGVCDKPYYEEEEGSMPNGVSIMNTTVCRNLNLPPLKKEEDFADKLYAVDPRVNHAEEHDRNVTERQIEEEDKNDYARTHLEEEGE